MAHNCAVLGVHVDALELYRCRDENALVYLDQVLRHREASERRASEQAQRA